LLEELRPRNSRRWLRAPQFESSWRRQLAVISAPDLQSSNSGAARALVDDEVSLAPSAAKHPELATSALRTRKQAPDEVQLGPRSQVPIDLHDGPDPLPLALRHASILEQQGTVFNAAHHVRLIPTSVHGARRSPKHNRSAPQRRFIDSRPMLSLGAPMNSGS